MSDKILFILLDAFRHDYINSVDTPFLYSKTQAGVYARKLKSTTGFTQRSAIFTGAKGRDTGMFTMYTFDPDGSPFRFLRDSARLKGFQRWDSLLDSLPSVPGLRRAKRRLKENYKAAEQRYREWIYRETKRYASHAPPSYIPLELLPFIGVSEDTRPIHLPHGLNQETVFDVFTRERVEYKFVMFPEVNCDDQAVFATLLDESKSSARVVLGQFSDSDSLIHHCGPSAVKRREVVGEIDRRLRAIASRYTESTTWVIIGDHGMTDVVEEMDVVAALATLQDKRKVTIGTDYLLFIDSTMARFRWLTAAGRDFVAAIPELRQFERLGRFVDGEIAAHYNIPIDDRRYGDLIWWANLGVLLFPDYFHDRHTHNKGMHGYDTDHDDMKGFLLAFGPAISPKLIDEAQLIDSCATLCAAVGVRMPAGNRGRPLLDG